MRALQVIVYIFQCIVIILHPGAAWAEARNFSKGVEWITPYYWSKTPPLPKDLRGISHTPSAYDVPRLQLEQLQQSGVDFIRISIDPTALLGLAPDERIQQLEQIIELCKSLQSQRLNVMISLSPAYTSTPPYSSVLVEGVKSAFPEYLVLVRQLSQKLSALPASSVALELMRGPPLKRDIHSRMRWQQMMQRLYRSARESAPRLILVINGVENSSIDGLMELDPAPFLQDTRVLFGFRYYAPEIFIYQGLPVTPLTRFTSGLHYPAQAEQQAAFSHDVLTRIEEAYIATEDKTYLAQQATHELARYFAGEGQVDFIRQEFGRLLRWAESHDLPMSRVILTEFGAPERNKHAGGPAPEDRLQWLADVSRSAEGYGIAWNIWALNGLYGATLYSAGSENTLNHKLLDALGLSAKHP